MSDPGLQRIRDLIEASSFGTPAAKRLRERTGDDLAEEAIRRADGRRPDLITGSVYLERGHPVRVITRWGTGGGPRNVLIERADGSRVVRPFRGLRRPAEKARETGDA
jgi:hypothetical protein